MNTHTFTVSAIIGFATAMPTLVRLDEQKDEKTHDPNGLG
jgi:hypothetical protein